jgi:hypothetical protein
MSPNWRWRMCPRCRNVERARDYPVLEYQPASWRYGTVARSCPHCGWEGPTYKFQVVRERHPQAAGERGHS